MEYMADLSMRYGAKMCLWLAADGMTRTPLIIDALTALYGKNWRHVRDGCDRNHYDHHIVVGSRLLMDNTGVVLCRTPEPINVLKDNLGRDRLPRPRPMDMCCFLRPVYEIEPLCNQYLHW